MDIYFKKDRESLVEWAISGHYKQEKKVELVLLTTKIGSFKNLCVRRGTKENSFFLSIR
jgi:hypothetical protein